MRGRRISHKSHVGSRLRGGCACSGRFDGWGHLAIARDLPLGRVRHAASGTHSGPPACTPQHVMPYLDYSPAFIRIVDLKIDLSRCFEMLVTHILPYVWNHFLVLLIMLAHVTTTPTFSPLRGLSFLLTSHNSPLPEPQSQKRLETTLAEPSLNWKH